MDPGTWRDMFPHHIHHIIKCFHPIQGRAAFPRGTGRMGADTLEGEPGADDGKAGSRLHPVSARGVPVKDGVAAVEAAGHDHIRLAASPLLGRTAEYLDSARKAARREESGNRDPGRNGGGSNQVVPAAVPVVHPPDGLPEAHRVLRKAREGVIFRHDPDYGTAAAKGGDEGGGDFRHSPLYAETILLQEISQGSRAAVFPESGFGKTVDPLLDAVVDRKTLVQIVHPHMPQIPLGGFGRNGHAKRGKKYRRKQPFHMIRILSWYLLPVR